MYVERFNSRTSGEDPMAFAAPQDADPFQLPDPTSMVGRDGDYDPARSSRAKNVPTPRGVNGERADAYRLARATGYFGLN